MKRPLITLTAACTLLTGCFTTRSTERVREEAETKARAAEETRVKASALPADNPCTDSLYVSLKPVKLEDMTERQYGYFLQKDAACSEYQRLALQMQPQQEAAAAVKKGVNTYSMLAVLSFMIGLGVTAWAVSESQ